MARHTRSGSAIVARADGAAPVAQTVPGGGHCVCTLGHAVVTLGQAVRNVGHWVATTGHCVATTGHWVNALVHCVVVGGQAVT
jgi:hypothetical protein